MYIYTLLGIDISIPFKTHLLSESQSDTANVVFDIKNIAINTGQNNNIWSKSNIYAAEYHNPGIGLFKISNGKKITLFKTKEVSKDLIISQLIFSPLALLMMQRKFLVLHGACIKHNGIEILLCGPSGSGKTSLLTRLIEDGSSYLSEDVVCYNSSDDKVIPSYPFIKTNISHISKKIIDEEILKIPKDKRNRSLIKTKNSFFVDKKSNIKKIFFLSGFGDLKIDLLEESFDIYRNILRNSWRSIPSNTCVRSQKMHLENISKFTINKEFYSFKLSKNIDKSLEYLKDHLS